MSQHKENALTALDKALKELDGAIPSLSAKIVTAAIETARDEVAQIQELVRARRKGKKKEDDA